MKRILRVVGQSGVVPLAEPILIQVGAKRVSVSDTDDGSAAHRFAASLLHYGAIRLGGATAKKADLRIVIRGTIPSESTDARLRAEVLAEAADIVLGSARASFARHLAMALSAP